VRTPSKDISADRDLTALSNPRAIPTRQIYKPRYAQRAFGPPRFARNNNRSRFSNFEGQLKKIYRVLYFFARNKWTEIVVSSFLVKAALAVRSRKDFIAQEFCLSAVKRLPHQIHWREACSLRLSALV